MVAENSNLWNNNIGRAAFIVGCLALEGLIIIKLDDHDSMQDWGNALKAVYSSLEMTTPDEGGMSSLEYKITRDNVAQAS